MYVFNRGKQAYLANDVANNRRDIVLKDILSSMTFAQEQ